MTRIGFDARMVGRTGIGTYIRELLGPLSRALSPGYELVAFCGKAHIDQIAQAVESERVEIRPTPDRIYGLEEQTLLPWTYHRAGLDLLHAPHYNQPLALRIPLLLTINDLIPLAFPRMQSPLTGTYNRFLLRTAVRRATHLIVPSQYTARDLTNRLDVRPERITVIPDGVHARWHPRRDLAAEARVLAGLGISQPFLLYVGQWKAHKNLPQLIAAFREVRRDHPRLGLVIGGRVDARNAQVRMAAPELGEGQVIFPGWLPTDALPTLFRAAHAFVLPSLYEGFGLPVLEAMACGTPVVCSAATSLPEVGGDAVEYWRPETGTSGLAAAIRQVFDPARRADLRARGLARAARFSWQRTAEETLDVYRGLRVSRRVGERAAGRR